MHNSGCALVSLDVKKKKKDNKSLEDFLKKEVNEYGYNIEFS